MKYLIAFLALSISTIINAAPFVESTPYPAGAVTSCTVRLNGGTYVKQPLTATRTCLIDVASSVNGANNIDAKASYTDPVWGEVEAAASNFTFSKPTAPAALSGWALHN